MGGRHGLCGWVKDQSGIFELGNSRHLGQTKCSFPLRNRSQVVAGKGKTSFSSLFLPYLPPLWLFFETRSYCVVLTGVTLSMSAGLYLTETHQALLPKCQNQGRAPATLASPTFVLNLTPLAPFALPTHAFFPLPRPPDPPVLSLKASRSSIPFKLPRPVGVAGLGPRETCSELLCLKEKPPQTVIKSLMLTAEMNKTGSNVLPLFSFAPDNGHSSCASHWLPTALWLCLRLGKLSFSTLFGILLGMDRR